LRRAPSHGNRSADLVIRAARRAEPGIHNQRLFRTFSVFRSEPLVVMDSGLAAIAAPRNDGTLD
jgi:hypothetical protein